MSDTTFRGWTRPGTRPPGGPAPEADETLDHFCGYWKLYQYAKGHRFSVDDLLVAWFGSTRAPRAEKVADLGSGIGSVAMATAWRLPGAQFVTVEAQAISLRLAKKSAAYNGVQDRFTQLEGDLRDTAPLEALGPFDLVTGSPPYWPLGTRVEAAHPQAIPARLEVRGTIADYAAAARRLLAPGGLFVCVFPNDQEDRARAAFQDADLLLVHRQEVIFKEGEVYGLLLLGGYRRCDLPENLQTHANLPVPCAPMHIRAADGSYHPDILPFRLATGFPPGLQ